MPDCLDCLIDASNSGCVIDLFFSAQSLTEFVWLVRTVRVDRPELPFQEFPNRLCAGRLHREHQDLSGRAQDPVDFTDYLYDLIVIRQNPTCLIQFLFDFRNFVRSDIAALNASRFSKCACPLRV